MKIILYTLIASLVLLTSVSAQNVSYVPENITITLNETQNGTVYFNITGKDNGTIYDDVSVNSTYMLEYTPVGRILDFNTTIEFQMVIGNISYLRSANESHITSIMFNDTINITALNETENVTLATIPLYINLSLPPIEDVKAYFFKKCIIEDDVEYCAEFNISEVQNITLNVTNETIDNSSYTLLLPYNLTIEFLERYGEILNNAAESIEESKQAIVEATNASIELKKRENKIYESAFILESYLKNEKVDLWTEIAPVNRLMNRTSLTETELADAMSLLISNQKITQKTEVEIVSLPIPNGIQTIEQQKTFIAATDRLEKESTEASAWTTVTLAVIVVILVLGILVFWFKVGSKRVDV